MTINSDWHSLVYIAIHFPVWSTVLSPVQEFSFYWRLWTEERAMLYGTSGKK